MIPHTDETLPTGKRLIRCKDANGIVTSEIHSYGTMKIMIRINFSQGTPTDETYFVNQRLVTRKTYEKARCKYDDMPPANLSLVDGNAELLRMVADQRRERRTKEKSRLPNPETATGIDDYCRKILGEGRFADAKTWIIDKRRNLGEMTHAQSKKLVDKLFNAGITAIAVCKIDVYDDCQENSGHLVVTLPDDKIERKKSFRYLGIIARQSGHEMNYDDGQKFEFLKLD